MVEVTKLTIYIPRENPLSSSKFFEAQEDIKILKAKNAVKKTLEQIAADSNSVLDVVYIKNIFEATPEFDNGSPAFNFTGIKGKLEFATENIVPIEPYLESLAVEVKPYGFTVDQHYEKNEILMKRTTKG